MATKKIGLLGFKYEDDPPHPNLDAFQAALETLRTTDHPGDTWTIVQPAKVGGKMPPPEPGARDLINQGVDIIVATGNWNIRAAEHRIRISGSGLNVVAVPANGDPPSAVDTDPQGHVNGPNVYGATLWGAAINAARVQLLAALLGNPANAQVRIVRNLAPPASPNDADFETAELDAAIKPPDFPGTPVITHGDWHNVGQIAAAVTSGTPLQAMIVQAGFFTYQQDGRAELLKQINLQNGGNGWPTIAPVRDFVDIAGPPRGLLMSYGPSLDTIFTKGASYTEQVLYGPLPPKWSDLAAADCELVVNCGTAAAYGLAVPANIKGITVVPVR